jgi:septum formation protein
MNSESPPRRLILASSSKYRKNLLMRFGIDFACRSPSVDETAAKNEPPAELVRRLAKHKAEFVSAKHPEVIVIGSDQVAVFGGRVIGKPGGFAAALEQLSSFSGQSVRFLTAVCVSCAETGFSEEHTDVTEVVFRSLQNNEMERYLLREKPYDCAGAFKAESLGITLFEKIISDDPTALIGLPLIRTAGMLRSAGYKLP